MAEEVVNRLKAEGQLIRNTGTNSIRSVRIQLDRFEDIFETISENIQLQTQMLTDSAAISAQQLKISEETAERDAARAAREELAQDQTPAPTPDTDSTSGKKTSEKKDKTGAGLFSMIGGLNLRRLLFGGALIAGGGFAAYNVLKGFIDEKTGGGFSDFEDGIVDMVTNVDFSEITEAFNQIKIAAESITNVLGGLADAIRFLIDNPLALFGGTVLGGFGLGRALGRASVTDGESRTLRSRLSKVRFGLLSFIALLAVSLGDEAAQFLEEQMNVPPEWSDPAIDAATLAITGATLGSMFGPTGILVGATAGLAISLGFSVRDWLNRRKTENQERINQLLETATEEESIAYNIIQQDIESLEAQKAALGERDKSRRRELQNQINALEAEAEELLRQISLRAAIPDPLQEYFRLLGEIRDIEEEIAQERASDPRNRAPSGLLGQLNDLEDQMNYLIENYDFAVPGQEVETTFGSLAEAGDNAAYGIEAFTDAAIAAADRLGENEGDIDQRITQLELRADQRGLSIEEDRELRALRLEKRTSLRETSSPSNVSVTPILGPAGSSGLDSMESVDYQNMSNQELLRLHHQLRDPTLQAFNDGNNYLYGKFMDQMLEINGILESRGLPSAWDIPFDEIGLYRRGTKGFQDFGPASFAILHGREAVVPEETPAGRFLNQFFTEDWTPKMAPSSDLSSRVTAASTATVNTPIIVNNSPTVAPVVNNVQGGPSVTNTNLFGSGGGNRSRNPYGLPDAIN